MFYWSERWAEASDILIIGTMVHFVESFCSIYLVYKYDYFLYQWKDLRFISLFNAYMFIAVWCLSFFLEIYLIFFSNTILTFLLSLYIAYFLIIFITLIPECIVIIAYEASLNITDRNENISIPGYYFSYFELFYELIGFYGDDKRLTDFLIFYT